jgi:hypothetical protein
MVWGDDNAAPPSAVGQEWETPNCFRSELIVSLEASKVIPAVLYYYSRKQQYTFLCDQNFQALTVSTQRNPVQFLDE